MESLPINESSAIVALDDGISFSGEDSPGDIITLVALSKDAHCFTEVLHYPCAMNVCRLEAAT